MRSFARTAIAILAATTLTAGSTGQGIPANPDDKTIVHVLNRIGFGPRAGEVERVRQIGLSSYIDQQLHPERIADAGIAARLADFDTINKSSRQLADEYFVPMLQARQQAKRDAGNVATAKPEMKD